VPKKKLEHSTELVKERIFILESEKKAGEERTTHHNIRPSVFSAWKVIKVEGGEKGHREKPMPKRKKKKSSAYIIAMLVVFFAAFLVYSDTKNVFLSAMLVLAGIGIGVAGS
jgi:hypothetical protein